jgi:hypothetical protein
MRRRPRWLAPIVVWVAASALLWIAIIWMQWVHPEALFDGFKLRPDASDTAWQTIRLKELWIVGPSSLWWMHIYPPLYDGIRYLFMQPELIRGVPIDPVAIDFRLYVMSAVLFGLVAMITYLWVRDLTKSGWWALGGAGMWVIIPASVSYMTLLNQTGLAIAAMAVAFYLLFRFCKTRRNLYAFGFLLALFIASMTRNVVQIHVFIVLVIAAFAFWFIGRPRRWWVLAINILLVLIIGIWPIRAYALYSTFDVSTHTGFNRAGALWLNPLEVAPMTEYPANLEANDVVLSSGWNTQEMLKENYRLGKAADEFIKQHPIEAMGRVAKSLAITVPVMFRSVYVQWYNAFDFAFPLSKPLDWIFSGWRFATLILAAALVIIRHWSFRGSLARVRRYGWFAAFWMLTAIPVFLSNRYWPPEVPEPVHSEADRLRGIIDVPVYVLITYAAWILAQRVRDRFRSRRIRDAVD